MDDVCHGTVEKRERRRLPACVGEYGLQHKIHAACDMFVRCLASTSAYYSSLTNVGFLRWRWNTTRVYKSRSFNLNIFIHSSLLMSVRVCDWRLGRHRARFQSQMLPSMLHSVHDKSYTHTSIKIIRPTFK